MFLPHWDNIRAGVLVSPIQIIGPVHMMLVLLPLHHFPFFVLLVFGFIISHPIKIMDLYLDFNFGLNFVVAIILVFLFFLSQLTYSCCLSWIRSTLQRASGSFYRTFACFYRSSEVL